MKTLKQFMEAAATGYRKVKSPDEQKFVDKHVVDTKADRAGNKDDVFKATNVKKADRKKENHGYEPGEDESVYEELKGGQKNLDKNHNGKLDAHDFKLLRKKKVAEEAEELDELSKATLGSYAKKAKDQMSRSDTIAGREMGSRYDGQRPSPNERKHNQRADKRYRGLDMAISKLAKEEAEQIDELSKGAMLKYLSANKKSDAAAQEKGDYSKSVKRMRGTDVAVRKYTAKPGSKYVRVPATEEVEIEEKTLTPAEMKKREEVVKAVKKSNPKMDKSMAYAIATKTAKRVAEEFEAAITGLSERHQGLMSEVFSRLNEDNQQKFAEACKTEEGLEAMVAFAIENRGE